ncbi:HAD-IA family hydrolase [Sphingomonas sp. H39-1-10]|uniref:HAD-IA family hydrolase n=1 Tax=Sphingomonas pollutisoli TaxID=3030829 RepID=UPI0023B98E23|nr:HAD-IA family hydrolase [Sphingomonas pollutisoli]MDF0490104.1 HAD-IA family hydrolase [Sphingomonas pollutisoli]
MTGARRHAQASAGSGVHRFRVRTVVFDLDGTLADAVPDIADAVDVMLKALSRPTLDVAQVRSMLGDSVHELVKRALTATGGVTEPIFTEGFARFVGQYEAHLADRSRPWPGVEEALSALEADGVQLAICTNKLDYLTRPFLDAMGWKGRFPSVVCGDTLDVRKPDPAPLLEAIRRTGVGPAAFVGDTVVDLTTARAARVPCLLMHLDEGRSYRRAPIRARC